MNHDLPPHNLEAEQCVLGSLMLARDPKAVKEFLPLLTAGDFYQESNAVVFCAISEMVKDEKPIELVLLKDHLAGTGKIEKAGGVTALMQMIEAVPSMANIRHYIQIVRDKSIRRKMITKGAVIAEGARDEMLDIPTVLADAAYDISEVREYYLQGGMGLNIATPDNLAEQVEADMDMEAPESLRWGFNSLDFPFGGLQPGTFNVLAARPSMGKTTLAMNVANHVALQGGQVVFVTLETAKHELFKTLLSINDGMFRWKMKPYFRTHVNDIDRLSNRAALKKIKESTCPIFLDSKDGCRTIHGIHNQTLAIHKRTPVALLVIDLFTKLEHNHGHNRHDLNMAESSRQLEAFIRDTGIPLLLLHQLNRSIEKEHRLPQKSDLRECGRLEEDADNIIFLSPDKEMDRFHKVEEGKFSNFRVGNLGKNKLGECTVFRMGLDPNQMKFRDVSASELPRKAEYDDSETQEQIA